MEGALTARDRVGIQDFVLLDETTEVAFLGNLQKRFSKDLIYVSLDPFQHHLSKASQVNVIVCPDGCRRTSARCWCRSILTKSWTSTTRKTWNSTKGLTFLSSPHTCEWTNSILDVLLWSFCTKCATTLPPCSYALADNAYQTMLAEFNNHFILISGESGAGKTEASKKILQYYAVSCPSTALLNTVRDKMLMSNPVLEVRWPSLRQSTNKIGAVLMCFGVSAGFWQRQNTEKWQLKSIWEVYGHSVWQPGTNQVTFEVWCRFIHSEKWLYLCKWTSKQINHSSY